MKNEKKNVNAIYFIILLIDLRRRKRGKKMSNQLTFVFTGPLAQKTYFFKIFTDYAKQEGHRA